jgi:hypothetical protein
MALEGQIIQHTEEGNLMYVLGHMKWATLAWPLFQSEDRAPYFYLDENKGGEWLHIHAPGAWYAFPTNPVWSEDFGLCFPSGPLESLTQNSLRRSSELSFNDLSLLAGGAGRRSRVDLLTTLASQFGQEFCDHVLEQDKQSNVPKKTVSHSHGVLVKAVFEYLDDDERKEFKETRDDVLKSEKAQVQKKWRDLLNQKTEEQKETYLIVSFHQSNCIILPRYMITTNSKLVWLPLF